MRKTTACFAGRKKQYPLLVAGWPGMPISCIPTRLKAAQPTDSGGRQADYGGPLTDNRRGRGRQNMGMGRHAFHH